MEVKEFVPLPLVSAGRAPEHGCLRTSNTCSYIREFPPKGINGISVSSKAKPKQQGKQKAMPTDQHNQAATLADESAQQNQTATLADESAQPSPTDQHNNCCSRKIARRGVSFKRPAAAQLVPEDDSADELPTPVCQRLRRGQCVLGLPDGKHVGCPKRRHAPNGCKKCRAKTGLELCSNYGRWFWVNTS